MHLVCSCRRREPCPWQQDARDGGGEVGGWMVSHRVCGEVRRDERGGKRRTDRQAWRGRGDRCGGCWDVYVWVTGRMGTGVSGQLGR